MVSGNPPKGATSQTIGGVSEIAVMAPIRKGRIPNERRTYEERLRMTIANLAGRVKQGLPTELDKVHTIHFGRMIIIRPEQYLVYSAVRGVTYDRPADGHAALQIPNAIDEYHAFSHGQSEAGSNATVHRANGGRPIFRSWLLTLVEFDGDLRTYFRDVAEFLGPDFDSVFRNCQDFPGTSNFEKFWAWIRRYQIETGLFYPRYRDLSVARIKQLQDFKRRFDAFVTKVRSPTGRRVESMDELFDEFLRKTQQYASDFPTPGGIYKPGED